MYYGYGSEKKWGNWKGTEARRNWTPKNLNNWWKRQKGERRRNQLSKFYEYHNNKIKKIKQDSLEGCNEVFNSNKAAKIQNWDSVKII